MNVSINDSEAKKGRKQKKQAKKAKAIARIKRSDAKTHPSGMP